VVRQRPPRKRVVSCEDYDARVELSSQRKGAIAESAVIHHALRLGVDVYRPVSEGGRYDLVFDTGPSLLRVQVKWAERTGDIVTVRCYSSRRAREGMRRQKYTAREVDLLAAYCADVDRVLVIGADRFDGRAQVLLRLAPCRNGQKLGVNWADDYALESLHWKPFPGP
jgi:PD-(D/E)XK endonuclease